MDSSTPVYVKKQVWEAQGHSGPYVTYGAFWVTAQSDVSKHHAAQMLLNKLLQDGHTSFMVSLLQKEIYEQVHRD